MAATSSMSSPPCPVTKIGYSSAEDQKMMETRQQLNEVMDVMRSNIEKMAERSDRLENLACRAEVLDMSASEFHKCAQQVHAKRYWKAELYKYVVGAVFAVCAVSGIIYLLV